MSGKKKKLRLPQMDDHLDLVPLIDCVFLLLLFFMLCGRMSVDQRTEQISVPPTKTAVKFDAKSGGWRREVINVFGTTQSLGDPPRLKIRIGTTDFQGFGPDDYSPYISLRQTLDKIYDAAEKYPDPKPNTGFMLPKVIVEIRADAETQFRVVQEVQQVLTDCLDLYNPDKTKAMQMKPRMNPATTKLFVNLDFTTRKTTD